MSDLANSCNLKKKRHFLSVFISVSDPEENQRQRNTVLQKKTMWWRGGLQCVCGGVT